MAGKIMIIHEGAAFMISSIETNMKAAGFEVVQSIPNVEEITSKKEDVDMYLLFAGDYLYDSYNVLVYLKDVCAEEEKMLCLIGYNNEIETIEDVIPKKFITKVFTRPFEMKTLSLSLKTLIDANAQNMQKKHILLVDDDVAFLRTLRDWFSGKYRITAVKSGMQAITYIAGHKPDLILLDYDMPTTPGPQIMEMIKSEPNFASIPIIFLTGKSDRESVMKVMALKPEGYILKSMGKNDIVGAVNRFFDSLKAQTE